METTIGNIADFQKGFAFKSKDYQDNGIRIVRVTNLNRADYSDSNSLFIDEDKAREYERYNLLENDVVISTVGSWPTNPASVVGKVAVIPQEINGSLLNQNAVRLRAKSECLQEYLGYILQDEAFANYIVGTAQGSASQASITLEDIRRYTVDLPSIDEQKRRISILKDLDQKLKNNNQINRNLSEQSFAIFHSMFDEIICTSDIVEFGNVASFKYGTMPKKDKICEEGYPLFSGYKIVGYYPEKMFDEPQLIIVARGVGGTGDIKYTPEKCYLTNLAIAIMANKRVYEEYLYHYLMCQDMKILNTGSAQPQITVSSLEKYKLYYPDEKAAKEFSDIVIPIRDRIRANRKENQKLEELRDSILPKLMSGELDVSDLDI